MKFDIITIFPKIFDSYFKESIVKRAQEKKKVKIVVHDLRKYTKDKHKKVDDRPYGGGPGMILKVEPIYKALQKIKRHKKSRIILLTPKGRHFTQKTAQKMAKYQQIVLITGHYEGFDERVRKLVDEEISIGQYVLTGGEIPAMVLVDAITRLIPGVLGHEHSVQDETYSKDLDYIEYPQYTRPARFKKWLVPKILLSGNHQQIADWRKGKAGKR
ncbi:MAG: tRNA (guanosine(37)-N1)-methyltransferase TrmD [Patescibacteria group bacterium]